MWQLQFGTLLIDSDGRLWRRRAPLATQLVVPWGERRGFIHRYHDSIFAGHLGHFWTFPGRFAGYLIACIVPDFAKTLNHIWPAVQYVWHGSLRVLVMRLWDMSLLVTDGTGWLWIFWTCWLPRKRVTGMF